MKIRMGVGGIFSLIGLIVLGFLGMIVGLLTGLISTKWTSINKNINVSKNYSLNIRFFMTSIYICDFIIMTILYIYNRVLYHLNVCSRGIISFFINNSSTKQFIVKIVRKIIK